MSLQFHTRITHGNGRRILVDAEGDGEVARVEFSPEPRGGADALWFCFRLAETEADKPHPPRLEIVMRYAETLQGGCDPVALRPVYRPEGQPWCRCSGSTAEYREDGQLLVSWRIPYPANETIVALCYPYGRDDLVGTLKKCRGGWKEDVIGVSQAGRPLLRLANDYGNKNSPPKGVYLVARQHSGETPGSWVLDGMLDRFARMKKNPFAIWVIPFADTDGIAAGDHGKGGFPVDLNQAWGDVPGRHETRVIQSDLARWSKRTRPFCVLDLHALGAEDMFTAISVDDDGNEQKGMRAWSNFLADALSAEYAAEEFARIRTLPASGRASDLCRYVHDKFDCAALSVEVPYTLCGTTLMTRKQYREVGHRLADALVRRARD